MGWHRIAGVGDPGIPDGVAEIDVTERFRDASWETLIGLTRSSGDSASAASSTLREAQPEYRMCMRASWAVSVFTFIPHAGVCNTTLHVDESGPGGASKVETLSGGVRCW